MSSTYFSAYVAVISARYRGLLQYRAAAFAGFVTQLFWGCIKIMIMFAFFAASDEPQPMSIVEVVSYIWLGQAMLGMLPWSIDKDIEAMIRSGDVSYELVRPLDLYTFWFCRTIALRTATTTLRAIPMVIFAMIGLPLVGAVDWALLPPADLITLLAFVISLGCALMLACAFTMLMHVVLVWTISGEGLNRFMPAIVNVFSGMIVPLPLFPDWMQGFLEWQPFRGLVDVPFRIYTGNIPLGSAAPDVALQLLWAAVFIWLGRRMLTGSMRRMVVQGG